MNWRFALRAALIAGVVALPFVHPLTAAMIAVAAGLFMLATERSGLIGPTPRHKSASGISLQFAPLRRKILAPFAETRISYPLAGLIIIILPFLLNRYQTEVLALGFIYVALAVGLNFIVGLCGLLALGYIAFYAVGAYTYALLNTHFGVNFFAALPLGLLTGAIAGALVGLPVLRLRGDYLAIVTLGFGEIVRIVLNNWDSLTRGPNGIMGIARPAIAGIKFGTPAGYYYLAAILAALIMFAQSRLVGSRIGRAWEAIREDELAAAHSGVPVVRMKMLAMILGGAVAAAAGTLFAARMTHVSPESFTFLESVLVLCMVVLGGMGSVSGAALGAVALIVVPELLRGAANYRMVVFALLLVLMMRFRRTGIIPGKRLKMAGGRA